MSCLEANKVTKILWWLNIDSWEFELLCCDDSANYEHVEWARERAIIVTSLVHIVTAFPSQVSDLLHRNQEQ
jgi:hypothetical protein